MGKHGIYGSMGSTCWINEVACLKSREFDAPRGYFKRSWKIMVCVVFAILAG